jgi:Tfp pilus assembly protein PilW
MKQRMTDESGFTMVELLVSSLMGIIVMFGVVVVTTASVHTQDRIARRVVANQTARPLMTRIVQELHSACVAPRITPIASGSTATSITFLSKSGSAVTPTPDLHTISLSGTILTEQTFPATGGAAPTWTFSGTASSTYRLANNVSAPSGVVFSYYQFVNGALATAPLTPPLDSTEAAHTAIVDISLIVGSSHGTSTLDPRSPETLNDSVDLRLENAGQYPNQDNLPCV